MTREQILLENGLAPDTTARKQDCGTMTYRVRLLDVIPQSSVADNIAMLVQALPNVLRVSALREG